MDNNTAPEIKVIDKMIFFFMIVFILSLSNSIFVNQIGYYACLVLFMVKWGITRKNPFYKSGLEFAFVWFITAEILSALLSDYQSASFLNAFKRSLLLPIVYVTSSASLYISRTKIYFKLYIIASLVTCLIYLYHSYSFFTQGLFSQFESGPSVFQYPITSSEIMSFTVVFLFAFLINEKTTWRNKLLVLIGFIISSAALFATYKRTGWLGTAFGILIILLMKKQWKVLIPAGAAILVFFILQKDESSFSIYSYNGVAEKKVEIKTEGRASDIYADEDFIYVADYEGGILLYRDSELIEKIETPVPVVSIGSWNNNIYGHFSDTRFIVYNKNDNGGLTAVNEFASPGFTTSYSFSDGFLYVMDRDSGLTVFSSEGKSQTRYDTIKSHFTAADENYLLTYSGPDGLKAYRLNKGLPSKLSFSYMPEKSFDNILFKEGKLITFNREGIELFSIGSNGINQLDSYPWIRNAAIREISGDKLFILNQEGRLFELNFPAGKIEIINEVDAGSNFQSMAFVEGNFYTTFNKRNRLLSFIDPYHPTNITRLNLWKTGLRIFRDYPIFGVGDIGLGYYHLKYRDEYEKEIHGHLHNNFMHILATLGLFGLLAVIFIFTKIILIDIKIYRDIKNVPFASSYSLGALGTFVAFLFSGLTELNFGDHEIITLVWFIFGLNLAFYRNYLSLNGN
jgi:hypothetical protein